MRAQASGLAWGIADSLGCAAAWWQSRVWKVVGRWYRSAAECSKHPRRSGMNVLPAKKRRPGRRGAGPSEWAARSRGPCTTVRLGWLPDDYLLVFRADHRLARLARERRGEGGQVRRRADRTEVRRGVWVGGQAHLQFFRGEVATPHRGPVEEEALVAGQAVGHRVGLAGGGLLHRVVGRGQAAEVGDVLAQR